MLGMGIKRSRATTGDADMFHEKEKVKFLLDYCDKFLGGYVFIVSFFRLCGFINVFLFKSMLMVGFILYFLIIKFSLAWAYHNRDVNSLRKCIYNISIAIMMGSSVDVVLKILEIRELFGVDGFRLLPQCIAVDLIIVVGTYFCAFVAKKSIDSVC